MVLKARDSGNRSNEFRIMETLPPFPVLKEGEVCSQATLDYIRNQFIDYLEVSSLTEFLVQALQWTVQFTKQQKLQQLAEEYQREQANRKWDGTVPAKQQYRIKLRAQLSKNIISCEQVPTVGRDYLHIVKDNIT